jgi:hypothetical protein
VRTEELAGLLRSRFGSVLRMRRSLVSGCVALGSSVIVGSLNCARIEPTVWV